jgi:hypothetical protein
VRDSIACVLARARETACDKGVEVDADKAEVEAQVDGGGEK